MQVQHLGGVRGAKNSDRPATVASPIASDRLQNAEMVATSMAVMPAVAYSGSGSPLR